MIEIPRVAEVALPHRAFFVQPSASGHILAGSPDGRMTVFGLDLNPVVRDRRRLGRHERGVVRLQSCSRDDDENRLYLVDLEKERVVDEVFIDGHPVRPIGEISGSRARPGSRPTWPSSCP